LVFAASVTKTGTQVLAPYLLYPEVSQPEASMDKRTGKRKSNEEEALRGGNEYKEQGVDDLGLEEMNGGHGHQKIEDDVDRTRKIT
jgi:hypothetical protein